MYILCCPLIESTHKLCAMIVSVADIAKDLQETDSSRHLQDISAHLATGKMQAGVVGLTNSGKSTTLNALMGKEFLTTSIQAQTAAEVRIIHDCELANGKLLGQLTKAQSCSELACGPENIYACLNELNDSIRKGKVKCPYAKLLLHAPIHFLKGVDSIQLEICDTAGTNEVGCTEVTSKSQLALRNLCTFVIILHVQHYEGKDELEMLKKLKEHHPDLQENQDRILILVNACDLLISDTNKASIKLEDIASRVQTHLKKVLGIHICVDHIVPFSAKWALKSRQWHASHGSMDEEDEDDYDEALLLLKRAKAIDREEKRLLSEHKDLDRVCKLLEKISAILTVEQKLQAMLYEKGPTILLRSTSSDSIQEIDFLIDAIEYKIRAEDSESKQAAVCTQKNFVDAINKIIAEHTEKLKCLPDTLLTQLAVQISAVTLGLEKGVDAVISRQLANDLHDLSKCETKQIVVDRICGVRPTITKQANAEAKTSWVSILEIVKAAQMEQLRSIFLELKTNLSLANLTQGISPGDITLPTISWDQIFNTVDPNSQLPPMPTLQLQLSSNSITDESLAAHIVLGEVTKYREEREKISGGRRYGIAGPRDSHHFTTYVPYSVPVYSPNIPALTSALSNALTTQWVKEFEKELKATLTRLTQDVAENATKHISDKLALPVSQLQQEVNKRQEVLQRSEKVVKQLEGWKQQLEEAKKAMHTALHKAK